MMIAYAWKGRDNGIVPGGFFSAAERYLLSGIYKKY